MTLGSSKELRVVGSGGVSLYVRQWGDTSKPTVLFVHGYPDNSDIWLRTIERLEARFHVVAYDVRGAGRSTDGWMFGGYALERLVADLRAVIQATAPADRKVHLVAHDWGAIQGWEAVLDASVAPRIASFTFFGAPCLDHAAWWLRSRIRADPRTFVDALGQLARSWYVFAFHAPLLAPLAWDHGLARVWPRLLRLDGVTSAPEPSPTQAKDGARGVWLYRSNFLHKLLHPKEGRTELPVQTVVSRRDPFVAPGLYSELAARVPNLWRRDLEAGHWTPLSHPDAIARWVSELVDYVEAGEEGKECPSLRRARTHARSERAPRSRKRFDGRLVVVTGAGSGIGRETAIAFAKLGAKIVAVDLDAASAQRTAELASLIGPTAHAYPVDVSDRAAMEALAKGIARDHGVPHIVVNNAGIGLAGPFLETSIDDWKRVIDVNLWGVIHGSHLFGEQMAKTGSGGHIVNVASLAAYLPSRSLSAYCTSKAAVLMLGECMRADLASSGIAVSTICPGVVNTNITRTTRFVGQSQEGERRQQRKVSALYRLRNFTPRRVAREIVRACAENRPMVPVTGEAKFFAILGRLSPAALRAFARMSPLSQ